MDGYNEAVREFEWGGLRHRDLCSTQRPDVKGTFGCFKAGQNVIELCRCDPPSPGRGWLDPHATEGGREKPVPPRRLLAELVKTVPDQAL
jgi:hypothetical protein